jgi:hypothetical protein
MHFTQVTGQAAGFMSADHAFRHGKVFWTRVGFLYSIRCYFCFTGILDPACRGFFFSHLSAYLFQRAVDTVVKIFSYSPGKSKWAID